MFEKSLQDLIKGIRNHKHDSASYISKAMVEIKKELRSTDKHLKFRAVQKVTYLQMLGVDVSFAAFHVVEVMSSPRFAHRRAGMLAASQIFDARTDVILLCTNLIKKEVHQANMYEAGSALNCLSNIATRELARDLLEDVAGMLNSSRPLLRKKAVLALYKLYLRYPQGLPQTFDRLRQRLDDQDMSVVSCAVNVICELSRKNPRNFLALAPQLFQLLTTSNNNWMLIKIVKLMSALLPEEPRLARKLLEPLAKVVETTQAKSLLYECIHAITLALAFTARADGSQPKIVPNVVALCTVKLREFVEDPDQNLKYLGLVGFVNLMRSHPRVVAEHKEMVLQCLLDDDVTVRLRALELLTGMVTKRNLVDIVQKLLQHVQGAEGGYRDELLEKIVFVCSRDRYAYLTNFTWYISVLVDLAHINGAPKGRLIRDQLVDVVLRVPSVRPVAVQAMHAILLEGRFALRASNQADGESVAHILYAASWIVCEYASLIPAPADGGGLIAAVEDLLEALLLPRTHRQPAFLQAALMHNVLKLVAAAAAQAAGVAAEGDAQVAEAQAAALRRLGQATARRLAPFALSEQIQVQERALVAIELLVAVGLCSERPCLEAAAAAAAQPEPALKKAKPEEEVDLLGDLVGPVEEPTAEAPAAAPPSPALEFLRSCSSALTALYADELAPVAPQAQSMVPVPEGLELEAPLVVSLPEGGFGETKADRELDAHLAGGGGARRVSFRDHEAAAAALRSTAYDYGLDSTDDDDDDDDDDDVSSSKKRAKKAKKKAKKQLRKQQQQQQQQQQAGGNARRGVGDPFYLTAATDDASSSADGAEHSADGMPPVVHLDPSALADVPRTTISGLFHESASHHAHLDAPGVILEDSMPAAARAGARPKRPAAPAAADEESVTLADIQLFDGTSPVAASGVTNNSIHNGDGDGDGDGDGEGATGAARAAAKERKRKKSKKHHRTSSATGDAKSSHKRKHKSKKKEHRKGSEPAAVGDLLALG